LLVEVNMCVLPTADWVYILIYMDGREYGNQPWSEQRPGE